MKRNQNVRRLVRVELPNAEGEWRCHKDEQAAIASRLLIKRLYGNGCIEWFATEAAPEPCDLVEPHSCLAFDAGLLVGLVQKSCGADPVVGGISQPREPQSIRSLDRQTSAETIEETLVVAHLAQAMASARSGKIREAAVNGSNNKSQLPRYSSASWPPEPFGADLQVAKRDGVTNLATMKLLQTAKDKCRRYDRSKAFMIEPANIASSQAEGFSRLKAIEFINNNPGRRQLKGALSDWSRTMVAPAYARSFAFGKEVAEAIWHDVELVRHIRLRADSYLDCVSQVASSNLFSSSRSRQLFQVSHFLKTLNNKDFLSFEEHVSRFDDRRNAEERSCTELEWEFVREYVHRKYDELGYPSKLRRPPTARAIKALKTEYSRFSRLRDAQINHGLYTRDMPKQARLPESAFTARQKAQAVLEAIRSGAITPVAAKIRVEEDVLAKWIEQLDKNAYKAFESAPNAAEPISINPKRRKHRFPDT